MDALERLRKICLALPGVTEKVSHGMPAWFAGRMFVTHTFTDDKVHGGGRESLWCAAPEGAQEEVVGQEPERFYRPPYVGHRGWLGVYLDDPELDWGEVAQIVEQAYRQVALKRLIAELDRR
ncbi:MmcQ/YjbR family DNA-binding protein [Actinokineospora sp. G85]|uniref:MmcQ/YjbR family DNA-binding protein n=1 Tax=Actinokineospora sp. G85 TaxID=3406626 RepID=UPI003C739740